MEEGRAAAGFDTSRIIEIEQSPTRLLLFGIGSAAFSLGSLALILNWSEPPSEDFKYWGLWLGVLFFALGACVYFWRMTWVGPVVVLSPEGIKDRRISAAVIPWGAIRSHRTWSYRSSKFLILKVEDDIERRLPLSLIAWVSKWPNTMLGAKGLCVTSADLRISHDHLTAAVEAYWQALGPCQTKNT
ncbi:STM3941 family protein [Jiella sonneratiae]|uniref:PH domain-containing protein n=1 Tax=Jiella sonneratiae TaxID=2816856 RepID=A0ABS3J0P4_9HYPH|nr:STM3941 family protein [Jiella sonneratiae]MBO0903255.1 hypothetical protein [Jiella sonneratiae]